MIMKIKNLLKLNFFLKFHSLFFVLFLWIFCTLSIMTYFQQQQKLPLKKWVRIFWDLKTETAYSRTLKKVYVRKFF